MSNWLLEIQCSKIYTCISELEIAKNITFIVFINNINCYRPYMFDQKMSWSCDRSCTISIIKLLHTVYIQYF